MSPKIIALTVLLLTNISAHAQSQLLYKNSNWDVVQTQRVGFSDNCFISSRPRPAVSEKHPDGQMYLVLFHKDRIMFTGEEMADTITDLGSKTCSQFRADTSAAAEANISNAKLIESYLKPHGLDKTDPRYWHMSILVHCVLNKKDTMLDGAKILVEELKQPPAKPSRAQLMGD